MFILASDSHPIVSAMIRFFVFAFFVVVSLAAQTYSLPSETNTKREREREMGGS